MYLPVIAIAAPRDRREIDAALADMDAGRFEWVVFTSGNAVEAVCARLGDTASFGAVRVAAVGPTTAAQLRARGVAVDLVPERATGEDLVAALGPGEGPVLLPRVEGAPRALPAALAARGWSPHEVTAYRNVTARPAPAELEEVTRGRFHAVAFASASSVRAFVAIVGAPETLGLARDQAPARIVACIGPPTAAAAEAAGMRVDAVASEHSAVGLADALAEGLAARRVAR